MPRKKAQKKRPDIVSMHLSPEARARLNQVCASRGMTIKMFLGRLLTWFVDLDRTEQSVVLGQVEDRDVMGLSEMIARRKQTSRKRA
jgi:hypothetical protein